MLTCETYRECRHLPEIVSFDPTANDAAGEFFRQHGIGIERQMRAVLFDRTDRQSKESTSRADASERPEM